MPGRGGIVKSVLARIAGVALLAVVVPLLAVGHAVAWVCEAVTRWTHRGMDWLYRRAGATLVRLSIVDGPRAQGEQDR